MKDENIKRRTACVMCGAKVPSNRLITCSEHCAIDQNRKQNREVQRLRMPARDREDKFLDHAF